MIFNRRPLAFPAADSSQTEPDGNASEALGVPGHGHQVTGELPPVLLQFSSTHQACLCLSVETLFGISRGFPRVKRPSFLGLRKT